MLGPNSVMAARNSSRNFSTRLCCGPRVPCCSAPSCGASAKSTSSCGKGRTGVKPGCSRDRCCGLLVALRATCNHTLHIQVALELTHEPRSTMSANHVCFCVRHDISDDGRLWVPVVQTCAPPAACRLDLDLESHVQARRVLHAGQSFFGFNPHRVPSTQMQMGTRASRPETGLLACEQVCYPQARAQAEPAAACSHQQAS